MKETHFTIRQLVRILTMICNVVLDYISMVVVCVEMFKHSHTTIF